MDRGIGDRGPPQIEIEFRGEGAPISHLGEGRGVEPVPPLLSVEFLSSALPLPYRYR